MATENSLNDKGINQTNELDCLRQIELDTKRIVSSGAATATAENQTTEIARLTSILAKIIAAPSTEATLVAINTLLGTTGIKILKPQGSANSTDSVVSVDDTAGGTTIAIARATRRGVLFVNKSTDKTAYVSSGTPTTASFPIAPGQQLSVTGVGTWKAIMDTAETTSIAVLDEYD